MGTSQRNAGTWGAAGLVAAMLLAAGQPAALGQVAWRSGQAEGPAPRSAQELQQAIQASASMGTHVVAQFARPITPAERDTLTAAGMHLLAPLGSNAYFASFEADARPGVAVGASALVDVQTIQLDWKWDPMLAAGQVPSWTIVKAGADPVVAVYVLYHRDVDWQGAILDLPKIGGAVVDVLETVNGAVVTLPYSRVADLASSDDVQWVEPALPQFSPTNAENRALTQVNLLQESPYDLDGTGVTALIYDAGRASNHTDFTGRLTTIDSAGFSDHATHVSGTVGGAGSITFNNRGMAPNVTLLSAGFEWDSGGIFLYEDPGDIEADYGLGISMGADVANNSIGSNTETNGFPCSIQGNYGVCDTVIDSIARGSLGKPIPIVWANGNERQGSSCDIEGFGDYYSIAPPAGAKNHITIGATNANDDSMTSFSSWGPTDDGRMKPDVSAPGCQIGGDGGVTSTVGTGGYGVFCGTSMASPTTCGITALLIQDFRAQFPGVDDPRGTLVKVLLAQTAQDRGNVGPDYQFGYGSVRAKAAIDTMRLGQFGLDEVSQGQVDTFTIQVEPGTPEMRYTVAWDDVPGTPNVNPALVNQLDLRLIDPDGGVHLPWVLNHLAPTAPATQGVNTRDNIEQVFVANPIAGEWTVEIAGTNVPEGPQGYAIVGSPNLDVPQLAIGVTSEVPELVPGGEALEVEVKITVINETLVPNSAKLFYRFDAGTFTEVALNNSGDGYVATIPGADCDDVPEFYVTAEGVEKGVVTDPPAGPDGPYSYGVGEIVTLVDETCEVETGWTTGVAGDTATTGAWDHGNPVGTGAQPEDDHTPSGTNCFFTGQGVQGGGLGDNDVDNGFTTLISRVFDLSDLPAGAEMSYYRWYSNDTGNAPHTDTFVIDISDDNGDTWTNLETVGPEGAGTSGGWIQHVFVVEDFVELTNEVRFRFIAEDDPSDGAGSLVEAAIDDLKVEMFVCESGCYADINGDGNLNILDFVAFQTAFQDGDPIADCDENGMLNVLDFVCYQGAFSAGCN